MSSSVSRDNELKFLLVENIQKELLKFLKSKGYDVEFKPKGLSNGKLAELSKSERRVLVTNDEDFAEFTKEEIHSVVWLRIPQDEPEALPRAFSKLLDEREKFEGYVIVLEKEKTEVFQLPTWKEFKR